MFVLKIIEKLKYRELELDKNTGKFGYNPKTHIDAVPHLSTINVTTDIKHSISAPNSSTKTKQECVSVENNRVEG